MNQPIHHKLKIVIMESPYYTLRDNMLARELFGKVLGSRLVSYLKSYPENVFPLSTEDFFSHHIIICEDYETKLEPIYSFKITLNEMCIKYGTTFPIVDMLQKRYHGQFEFKKLEKFVNEKIANVSNFAYFGSRSKTVERSLTKEESIFLFHLGLMALVNASHYFNITEFILFGVLNNDAYKYCEMMGMKKVINNTVILDSLGSCSAYVLHKEKFSDLAIKTSQEYSKYWNNRLHISVEDYLAHSYKMTG